MNNENSIDNQEHELEKKKYSLEVWKAIASLLTPVVLVFLTFQVNSVLKEKEHQLKVGEQILKEKQSLYSEMGHDLNIIFVYIADVGDFRKYAPLEVIEKKRKVDRLFWMYAPYWSSNTEEKYKAFMSSAFEMYNGSGIRAKIKAYRHEKVAAYQIDEMNWNEKWNNYFTENRDNEYFDKYYELVESLLSDIVSTDVRKLSKP